MELQKTSRRAAPPAVVWTIAGFDPSGGAGVTADLMTFAAHGLFGCSAVTALTVQSTQGVFGSEPVRPEVLQSTLQRLDEDLPAAGIKIGMLGSPEMAQVVAGFLACKRAGNSPRLVVVLDPVLRSSAGRSLYPEDGLDVLREQLMPWVDWITPNWAELSMLTGEAIANSREAEGAAGGLLLRYPELAVVATGGDQAVPSDLVVRPGADAVLVRGEHIATTSTHGTGCAFSSALLAQLVSGAEPLEAVRAAKDFVEGALRRAPELGGGRGPMDLLWPLRREAWGLDVATLRG